MQGNGQSGMRIDISLVQAIQEGTKYFCSHVCINFVLYVHLSKWLTSLEQDDLLINTVGTTYIYDVRSGEFKVALVKEDAWRAIAGTLQRTGEMILLVLACFFYTYYDCVSS